MKAKIANSLLRQRDDHRRRRMILAYSAVLVLLFVGHSYLANLTSPLRLIPQTAAAVGMGYLLLAILSLRQFKVVADFIDWAKVMEIAERVERTGGSRFALLQFERQRRLPPVAHADRSAALLSGISRIESLCYEA